MIIGVTRNGLLKLEIHNSVSGFHAFYDRISIDFFKRRRILRERIRDDF